MSNSTKDPESYPNLLYTENDVSQQIPDYSKQSRIKTLDEPVSETIKRDLYHIGFKLKAVLLPSLKEEAQKELRKCNIIDYPYLTQIFLGDLWGPLLLCISLAFILGGQNTTSAQTIFATVFILIWVGAFVLTLNARFLGGNISIFQSVCVLGYCVFPINIGAFGLLILNIMMTVPGLIKFCVCGFTCFWSCVSSLGFMGALVQEDKKVLANYPVVLFYVYLSWLVLISSYQKINVIVDHCC